MNNTQQHPKRYMALILLWLCSCLGLYAQEQRVTVQLSNVSLKEVFAAIEKQTTYRFSYMNVVVSTRRDVSVHEEDAPVTTVLDRVLAGRNLSYNIVSQKSIVIFDKKKSTSPAKPRKQVTGTIVDENGEPVIGASVKEDGTANGTISDIDGHFKIEVPADAVLQVSYVGYSNRQIPVNGLSQLNISLQENTEQLQEVVVTGYTTQRKSDLTGAISVVSMDEQAKQNENNPIKALQGRVPGMNVSADGNPSGSSSVQIRGVGTLNNTDPLYIIDGVPTKGGMHELNGNDIESIQVLKDAASASIYGSRAANGVIIITTKKGKEGQLKINFDASVAASMYTNKMEVLNTKEYGQALWQAFVNDGKDPNTNPLGYSFKWGYNAQGYPVLNYMSLSKYLDEANTVPAADTDWFDETTRTGVIQQYNISMSNGSQKGTSFFSLGYYKNLGIIKYSDFDRISARMNTEYNLIGKILTVGEHFTLNRTSEVQAPGGFLENVLQANPSLPVYKTDGELAGPVGGYADRENPLARLQRNADNRYIYWRMLGDAYINLNPFKGFNIRSTFGLDYSQKMQRIFTYPITEGNVANDKNAVEAKQEHWIKWVWNAVATYNIEIGKHRTDAMLGTELNREDDVYFSGYKEDFAILTPDYMWPDAGSGTAQAYGSGGGYSLVSFFAKANYTYDDKYLFSLTVRRDGSSRFGKNNRYATFPSVSAGWRLNREKFMADASWIDDLKLRASWGQTGNQEIDNNARYTLYVPNYGVSESGGQSYGTSYDIVGSNGGSILQSGFKRNQIGNDNIKWETTTQTNIGLDFSFFNQSLYGNLDWFFKKTTDILISMPGVAAMGEGSSQWINAGAVENKGVELNIGYRNRTSFGLKYDVAANLSAYRNKITELPTTVIANGTFGGNGVKSVIGHARGSQVGYVADGIFKSQDEIDNHATQEGAGLGRIRWRDLDGNGVINEQDQQWIYDPTPAFSYGLNIYLEYKNFDLTLFWQGVQGVDVITDLKKETDLWSGVNVPYLNKGKRVLDAWPLNNPGSDIPALSTTDINRETRVSTYYVEDGSFLKLRNVQLGYNVPQSLSRKIKMERLRFYLSAQNALTIHSKKFTGVDPENVNFGYPIPMNLTFGINVGF